jgi:MoaA/NifB/PqqE/SkfB family radical SAM enzyme
MHLGLVFTNKCNARCAHCTTACGPDRNDKLSLERIERLMSEAIAIEPGSPSVFSITGGEPFLYWRELGEMIGTGTRLGAKMTCVTNGSWATSYERAVQKLRPLRDAGLKILAISTSEYHQEFVPLSRVRMAARVAIDLGVQVVIKYPYRRDGVQPDDLAEELGEAIMQHVSMETFSVMPFVRPGYHLDRSSMVTEPGIPEGTCPAAVVTIREDGQVYTCCIPGGFVDPLKVGNIETDDLGAIHDRFAGGDLQQLLFAEGPAYIAKKAISSGLGGDLEDAYTGICHLCVDILAKPRLRELALRTAEEYQLARLSQVFQHLVGGASAGDGQRESAVGAQATCE